MLSSHVALGLPTLPAEVTAGTSATSSSLDQLLSYVNGDHRIRLWSSRDGLRLAELLPTAELAYVANRNEAWAWNSETFTAYRASLPRDNPFTLDQGAILRLLDPAAVSRLGIDTLDPTTTVTLGTPVRVAGRPAYALELIPKASGTLVGRIEIDVDAAHWVALRTAVYAKGATSPALSLGYQTVGFGRIDPSVFSFRPPSGATIKQLGAAPEPAPASAPLVAEPETRVVGTGWASVASIRLPSAARIRALSGGIDIGSFLPLSGPLFSMRLVVRGDHSWLLLGAVSQSRLRAVSSALP